ncbi:unnamed protein product, partial [Prorocentrum cordatum]
ALSFGQREFVRWMPMNPDSVFENGLSCAGPCADGCDETDPLYLELAAIEDSAPDLNADEYDFDTAADALPGFCPTGADNLLEPFVVNSIDYVFDASAEPVWTEFYPGQHDHIDDAVGSDDETTLPTHLPEPLEYLCFFSLAMRMVRLKISPKFFLREFVRWMLMNPGCVFEHGPPGADPCEDDCDETGPLCLELAELKDAAADLNIDESDCGAAAADPPDFYQSGADHLLVPLADSSCDQNSYDCSGSLD